MGKRKTSKVRTARPARAKLATTFDCPFCNRVSCVETAIDRRRAVGTLFCRVCRTDYSTRVSNLTEPVDIYGEWIDRCEEANGEDPGSRAAGGDGAATGDGGYNEDFLNSDAAAAVDSSAPTTAEAVPNDVADEEENDDDEWPDEEDAAAGEDEDAGAADGRAADGGAPAPAVKIKNSAAGTGQEEDGGELYCENDGAADEERHADYADNDDDSDEYGNAEDDAEDSDGGHNEYNGRLRKRARLEGGPLAVAAG